jgi:hypothetical protein
MNSPWFSSVFKWENQISHDQGRTYNLETDDYLLGAYFMISEERVDMFRNSKSYFDVLAQLGGFFGIVYAIFRFIIGSYNRAILQAKLVENLFFEFPQTAKDSLYAAKVMKFSWWETMSIFYQKFFRNRVFDKQSTKFLKGVERLKNDFNIFTII